MEERLARKPSRWVGEARGPEVPGQSWGGRRGRTRWKPQQQPGQVPEREVAGGAGGTRRRWLHRRDPAVLCGADLQHRVDSSFVLYSLVHTVCMSADL